MDVNQTYFFAARRIGSLTQNCVEQGIWSAPELSSRQARAAWNLGICYTFCMWHQVMDSTPFFFVKKRSLEGAACTISVRLRWYKEALISRLLATQNGDPPNRCHSIFFAWQFSLLASSIRFLSSFLWHLPIDAPSTSLLSHFFATGCANLS